MVGGTNREAPRGRVEMDANAVMETSCAEDGSGRSIAKLTSREWSWPRVGG